MSTHNEDILNDYNEISKALGPVTSSETKAILVLVAQLSRLINTLKQT